MNASVSYKTNQFLLLLIKLGIVVGAFYFIYYKLLKNDALDFHSFLLILDEKRIFSLKNVSILLILTVFNWIFEILKWQNLVSIITHIPFKKSFEQSLASLTSSLFTPNRIGEYGAKIVYFQKADRKKIMLLNLLGNMVQMATTLLFGICGLLFLLKNDYLKLHRNVLIPIIIGLGIAVFVIWIFKRNDFKIKGFPLKRIFQFVYYLPKMVHLKNAMFSVIRYLVFSFQFFVLLTFFDVGMDYFTAMMAITSVYFLSSVIPSIFLFDVVIKGSVAVFVFSMLGVDELTILSVVTLMWILNFVLPSVLGSYFVLNFNLPKSDFEP